MAQVYNWFYGQNCFTGQSDNIYIGWPKPTEIKSRSKKFASNAIYSSVCRELLVSNFMIAIRDNTKLIPKTSDVLLYTLDPEDICKKGSVDAIEKILHSFEQKANLPKSRVYDLHVTYKDRNKKKHVLEHNLFVRGNIDWFRNTYTHSLYILILRLLFANAEDLMKNDITDFDAFKEYVKTTKSFKDQKGRQSSGVNILLEDKGTAFNTIDFWEPVMSKRNKIFPTRLWKKRFDYKSMLKKNTNVYINHEGIKTLLSNSCAYVHHDLVKELMAQVKGEK